jgi:lysophospholipase L1-like esterase
MRSFVLCLGVMGAALALTACGGDDAASDTNMHTTSAGGSSGSGGSNGTSGTNGAGGESGSATGTGGESGSSAGNGGNGGSAQPDSGSGDAQKESGTSGDASSDGASAYNPCPAKGTPCLVMGLGDSITEGAGSSTGGSYRTFLYQLALGHSQNINLVGNTMTGPDMVNNPLTNMMVAFPKGSEGHSGFTIDDGGGRTGIHNLIGPSMNKYHPHIITLMIGTNDVNIQLDLADAPRRLGGVPNDAGMPSLMDTIFMTDPNVLLVVAKIVPTTDDNINVRVRAYNDAIPALVQRHIGLGHHILMVDMYGAFTANANFKTEYMSDTLHPKDTGYSKMADVWYAAIGPLFR